MEVSWRSSAIFCLGVSHSKRCMYTCKLNPPQLFYRIRRLPAMKHRSEFWIVRPVPLFYMYIVWSVTVWQLHVFNCVSHFCAAVNYSSTVILNNYSLDMHGKNGFDLFVGKLKYELELEVDQTVCFFFKWKGSFIGFTAVHGNKTYMNLQ